MPTINDGDREQIIRDAIKSAQAKGIALRLQGWGVVWHDKKGWIPNKQNSCCALGCVLLEGQDKIQRKLNWRSWTIETILGCDADWIRSFQRGFDRYERVKSDDGMFAYDLGMLLSEELIGKDAQTKLPYM